MHGIVVDTSVFIASLRSRRGASFRLLELRSRSAVADAGSAVDDIVEILCRTSRQHAIPFRLRPELADPNDDFVLELAFIARCASIVTHNIRHLRTARRFGIGVATPGQFLRIIGIEP